MSVDNKSIKDSSARVEIYIHAVVFDNDENGGDAGDDDGDSRDGCGGFDDFCCW